MTQIDSRLVASAGWPNVIKTKITAKKMTYSIVDVVPSSHFGEQLDKEDDSGDNGQWDGKTRWDHLPKVKVRAKQLGVIGNKSCDRIQKELDSYFLFPKYQQQVAMLCDPVETLALGLRLRQGFARLWAKREAGSYTTYSQECEKV
jgi:hypothetical protein